MNGYEPVRGIQPAGVTRSHRTRNYALITPDTHVASQLVGWRNASAVIHISPELGARFWQYTAMLAADAASALPGEGIERFVYVLTGNVSLTIGNQRHDLSENSFAYLPAGVEHHLSTSPQTAAAARLEIFERRYRATTFAPLPTPQVGSLEDVPGDIFMGDADLRLQVLLPPEPGFDMAVNVFSFQPGATLPQVEIHVMEHGLLMLMGAGVYRLGNDYHPVQAGDVIWMASYCPQWFVAMGKQPARYLYYKDVHRERACDD